MRTACCEMGRYTNEFAPVDAEPVNAPPAPRRTPAAVVKSTREIKVRDGWYLVQKTVTVGGTGQLDRSYGQSAIRRLTDDQMADECYEGRPDEMEDALIAVLDREMHREELPTRAFATMSRESKRRRNRKRGRWLEGKVRKPRHGAVPRM